MLHELADSEHCDARYGVRDRLGGHEIVIQSENLSLSFKARQGLRQYFTKTFVILINVVRRGDSMFFLDCTWSQSQVEVERICKSSDSHQRALEMESNKVNKMLQPTVLAGLPFFQQQFLFKLLGHCEVFLQFILDYSAIFYEGFWGHTKPRVTDRVEFPPAPLGTVASYT